MAHTKFVFLCLFSELYNRSNLSPQMKLRLEIINKGTARKSHAKHHVRQRPKLANLASIVLHFLILGGTGTSCSKDSLQDGRALLRLLFSTFGEVALSTFLRLLLGDFQIQILGVLADKAHVMGEHGELTNDLSWRRIGEEHDTLGSA